MRLHQSAGVHGDPLQDLLQVQRRNDRLRDAEQRFEFEHAAGDGLVQPRIMNDLRGLIAEGHQQFLVFGAERILAGGIHVEHADQRAFQEQRHGQFAADVFPDGNVSGIRGHVGHAQRLASFGDPTRYAAADGELELAGFLAEADGDLDFEELRVRIDQNNRPAGGPHHVHRLAQHEVEDRFRIEGGIDDAADAGEQLEAAQPLGPAQGLARGTLEFSCCHWSPQ